MSLMPYEIRECKTGSYYCSAPTLKSAQEMRDHLFRSTDLYFVIQKVKDYA